MIVEIDLLAGDFYMYTPENDNLFYIELGHKNPFRVWERQSPLLF